MAAIDFPNNPQIDDIHIHEELAWSWDGVSWKRLFEDHNFSSKIGIGTTAPQEEIHIKSVTPVIRIEDIDGGYMQIVGNDGSIRFDADNTNSIADTNVRFIIDGSEKFRINHDGKVGIGTNSPDQDVFGDAEKVLHMKSSNVATLRLESTHSAGADFEISAGNSLRNVYMWNKSNGGILFATNNSEVMRINASGNVDIGNSSSNVELKVNDHKVYHEGNLEIDTAIVFSTAMQDTPEQKWVSFTIPHIGGSGTSNYYYFDVYGYSDIGTMDSQLHYRLYIHVRADGNNVNAINIKPLLIMDDPLDGPTEWDNNTEEGFNFYYTQTSVTDSKVWIHLPEDYSALDILSSKLESGGLSPAISSMFAETSTQPSGLISVPIIESLRTEGFNTYIKGSVGIGTATPSRTLEVVDVTNDGSGGLKVRSYLPVIELQDMSTGGGSSKIQQDQLAMKIGPIDSNTYLSLNTEDTERMRIDKDGNVGIGTLDPSYALDVRSDTGINVRSLVNGSDGAQIRFSDHSSQSQYGWIRYKHSDGAIASGELGTSTDGFLIGGSEDNTIVRIQGGLKVDGEISENGSTITDKVTTWMDRGYVLNHQAPLNLAVGWYTIAINTGDRASARFGIWDIANGKHQSVTFYASSKFGQNAASSITVLHNTHYSGSPFRHIRIKDASTYDGAVLQVYVDVAENDMRAAILGDNFQSSGWDLVDWISDATDPGGVSNYSSMVETSKVDLDLIQQGGFATTGEIYAGGNGVSGSYLKKVYHEGNFDPTDYLPLSGGTMSGSLSISGSLAAGDSANTATAPSSIALGKRADATYLGSIAIGTDVNSTNFYSIAMGKNMNVSGSYSFGIGLDNGSVRTLSQVSTMAIMGGKVGIGTLTPTEVLEVTGNAKISGSIDIGNEVVLSEGGTGNRNDLLQISSTTSSWGGISIKNSSNEGRWSFMTDGDVAGIYNEEDSHWSIYMRESAGLDLYYGSTKRLETTSSGVGVIGSLTTTGTQYFNFTGGTLMRVGSNSGSDVNLMRVSANSIANDSGDYGFSVRYMGSRGSNNNSYSIWSDNQESGTQIEAFKINQDGKLYQGGTNEIWHAGNLDASSLGKWDDELNSSNQPTGDILYNGGNVGIGVTSVNEKLRVNGGCHFGSGTRDWIPAFDQGNSGSSVIVMSGSQNTGPVLLVDNQDTNGVSGTNGIGCRITRNSGDSWFFKGIIKNSNGNDIDRFELRGDGSSQLGNITTFSDGTIYTPTNIIASGNITAVEGISSSGNITASGKVYSEGHAVLHSGNIDFEDYNTIAYPKKVNPTPITLFSDPSITNTSFASSNTSVYWGKSGGTSVTYVVPEFKDFKKNHNDKYKLGIYSANGYTEVIIEDLISDNPTSSADPYRVYWDDEYGTDSLIWFYFSGNDLYLGLSTGGGSGSNNSFYINRIDMFTYEDYKWDLTNSSVWPNGPSDHTTNGAFTSSVTVYREKYAILSHINTSDTNLDQYIFVYDISNGSVTQVNTSGLTRPTVLTNIDGSALSLTDNDFYLISQHSYESDQGTHSIMKVDTSDEDPSNWTVTGYGTDGTHERACRKLGVVIGGDIYYTAYYRNYVNAKRDILKLSGSTVSVFDTSTILTNASWGSSWIYQIYSLKNINSNYIALHLIHSTKNRGVVIFDTSTNTFVGDVIQINSLHSSYGSGTVAPVVDEDGVVYCIPYLDAITSTEAKVTVFNISTGTSSKVHYDLGDASIWDASHGDHQISTAMYIVDNKIFGNNHYSLSNSRGVPYYDIKKQSGKVLRQPIIGGHPEADGHSGDKNFYMLSMSRFKDGRMASIVNYYDSSAGTGNVDVLRTKKKYISIFNPVETEAE